jgi:hypothetical protein
MSSAIGRSISWLVAMGVTISAFSASATTILVNFDSDLDPLPPANVADGFMSVDSSLIQFSDTDGDGLVLVPFDGSIALAVLDDSDGGLLMEFGSVISGISLEFGNTLTANPMDTAVLTVFLGVTEVGNVSVGLNMTVAIDQMISYSGALFDSAVFKYNVAGGLTEVVDNVQITLPALPEPHAGLVFGMGALLVGAVCGRRSPTEVKPRIAHD